MPGRLLKIALALWVLRWAAMEVAAYAARHWVPPRRDPGSGKPRAPG